MSVKLGVNIDHVATLRQQRLPAGKQVRNGTPDPLYAALVAQENGADSIVAHLREDRRHIQDRDMHRLKQTLAIPLAMEMAATEEMERIALDVQPARVCLVPEKRQELTTEGGLDVIRMRSRLSKMISRFHSKHICVSLFIEADSDQVKCAKSLGVEMVELHTGRYAQTGGAAKAAELLKLLRGAELVGKLKLELHAGHGLDYRNVAPIARLPGMVELNIGFSIIARALFSGLGPAVSQMKTLIS